MRRILAAAVLAAAVAVMTGCAASTPPPLSEKAQKYYDENVVGATAGATGTKAASVVVSVLSDSHAFNADSWWRQTVVARKVPGITLGAFESQPGAGSSALAKRLDAAAAKKGTVIIQAGTNDLLSGMSPADAAAGIEELWAGIKERGATPVAALVPPSDTKPAEVVELNQILNKAAAEQRIEVLDVYSPVANEDGTWLEDQTKDGVHANKAGSDLMTAAALKQLPSLAGL